MLIGNKFKRKILTLHLILINFVMKKLIKSCWKMERITFQTLFQNRRKKYNNIQKEINTILSNGTSILIDFFVFF
jgi:hypothetical protein